MIYYTNNLLYKCSAELFGLFSPLSSHSMKKNNSVGMVMVDISLLSGLMPNIKDLEHVHMHLSFLLLLLLLHVVLKNTLYFYGLLVFYLLFQCKY